MTDIADPSGRRLKILADEHVSKSAISLLRTPGHDVVAVKESLPGFPDRALLRLASEHNRTIVTFDKDFGELIFRDAQAANSGVVLFRPIETDPSAEFVAGVIESRTDWTGLFAVVTDQSVRIRQSREHDHGVADDR